MSIDTWHSDWVQSEDYNKLKLEDQIRLYEKFIDKIEDLINPYDKEDLKTIVEDIEKEIDKLKEGIENI